MKKAFSLIIGMSFILSSMLSTFSQTSHQQQRRWTREMGSPSVHTRQSKRQRATKKEVVDLTRGQRVKLDDNQVPFRDEVLSVNPGAEPSMGEARSMTTPTERAAQVIYLHRGGGTFIGGSFDDPARNLSVLVGSLGFSSVNITPFQGSDAEWQTMLSCMKDLFSRFNAIVTDVKPASGDYIETVFAGDSGSVMGLGDNTIGYAPMDTTNCVVLPRSIVFVFTQLVSNQRSCEVAGQETGHAIGLDHEYLCKDPMTYLLREPSTGQLCGNKTFQDLDAECGEYSPRQCLCRRVRQNSVRIMLDKLGPNPGPTPPPNPGDPIPPVVNVMIPPEGASLPANTEISITADITDNVGVASAELLWDFTGGTLTCPSSGTDWSCARSGTAYTWKLNVGTGDRTYRVRAKDAAGNTTVSNVRIIHLTTGGPPTCTLPTVLILSPASGTTLKPGDPFSIRADIRDHGSNITDVQMIWSGGPTGTYLYPLTFEGGTIWKLETSMSPQSPLGDRQLSIRATNEKGERLITSPLILHISR